MKLKQFIDFLENRITYFEKQKHIMTQDVGSIHMLGHWLIDLTICLNKAEQFTYWNKCSELFSRIKILEGFDTDSKLEDFIE